jgi:hypothetical protein
VSFVSPTELAAKLSAAAAAIAADWDAFAAETRIASPPRSLSRTSFTVLGVPSPDAAFGGRA